MKYIIDIPDKQEKDWVGVSPLLGNVLYVPLISIDKKYHMPTGIKLTPYNEWLERKMIEDEVWDLAQKIECMAIGEIEEAFDIHGEDAAWLHNQMSYQEAKVKYEVWKKSKDVIHVGDEVRDKDLGDVGVVTYVNNSCCCVLWANGVVSEEARKSELRSTGRHFNITHEMLKKMKEHRENERKGVEKNI